MIASVIFLLHLYPFVDEGSCTMVYPYPTSMRQTCCETDRSVGERREPWFGLEADVSEATRLGSPGTDNFVRGSCPATWPDWASDEFCTVLDDHAAPSCSFLTLLSISVGYVGVQKFLSHTRLQNLHKHFSVNLENWLPSAPSQPHFSEHKATKPRAAAH